MANIPIRILMFGWEFPPHNSGGLGVACYGLTRALVSRGAQITFVLPQKAKFNSEHLRMVFADGFDNVKFISIDSPLAPYMTSRQYKFWERGAEESIYGATLFEEVKRYSHIAKKIAQKENHDIIHAHDWLCFGAGVEAKKISKKPLVSHVHATEFDRAGGVNVNGSVYALEKSGMENSDQVVAVSNYTKDIITRFYGIDTQKVEVVHNGADYNSDFEFDSSDVDEAVLSMKKMGGKIIVFAGRLTIQKGPDYFLRVAQRVLKHDSNVLFIVAGSGEMEAQLVQQAALLGIGDKVVFTGFLRGKELVQVYKAADLCIMPSVSEPFGLIPLEALRHHTPVMVSKQSGVSEVLTNALKVDFWDVDEMANQIMAVLNHSSLKTCLAEYGEIEARSVTWGKAAEKCMGIYGNLLNNNFKINCV